MSTTEATLLNVAGDGQRTRRALAVVRRASGDLSNALRRALPFLVRRGAELEIEAIAAVSLHDARANLASPTHTVELVTQPSGAHGAILLDRRAVSMVFDGVLGAEGPPPPDDEPAELTPTQSAVVRRVIRAIVDAFCDVMVRHAGVRFEPIGAPGESPAEGIPICCRFRIALHGQEACIVLLLPKDALVGSSELPTVIRPTDPDPRVLATLGEAEIELVAELGRRRFRLSELANLQPGTLLRLDLPLETEARVHVRGRTILSGRPTSHAGQVCVRIARPTDDSSPRTKVP
jgi:flagellar motor switch protein FliM